MAGKRTSLAALMVGQPVEPEAEPLITAEPAAPRWPDTVRLEDLADNPDNPRDSLRDLEGLADTIRDEGLLQDLVVVPRDVWLAAYPHHAEAVGDRPYVIQHGHRRRHAAALAGLTEVPVKVRDSAESAEERTLIENFQRDDLTPLEEARALQRLMELREISLREACRKVGKSAGWGSQRLVLLKLIPELQQALVDGVLRVEDAREIGKLPPEEQAMPAAPSAVEAVASAEGGNRVSEEGVYAVNTLRERPAGRERAAGGRRDHGVIPLGPPESIAAELRARLSLEDLEKLVELLSVAVAR
ncbi:ParB/RepB/Spo0J family partition protein [Planomonospora sp. ID67723]|uniref:ParB/RepB/Spo0J family partition protein n=1 Tax=Planomonospora sp. ID67723 TaxID=2738134 RepID=UPI0018C38F13|nr:ParB/RepB/Spo0J family partition protein [Planomonospora sp. ID67723]MBG0833250.1 ParB/RepB/Spo0J family partition protein [Planomonospora sp. ID67723]